MANAAPSEPNSKQKAKVFIRSSRYIHATPSASAILSLNLQREVFFASLQFLRLDVIRGSLNFTTLSPSNGPAAHLSISCPARAPSDALFDHLVGAAGQEQKDRDAERLGGFEVYDQLNFRSVLPERSKSSRTLKLQHPLSAMSYCHMSFDWCSEPIGNAVGGKCISYVGGNPCLCLLVQASNCCRDGGC